MVEGLIGMKIGMTQTFDEAGNVIPVTVIKAGPCTVIQKKTQDKDGYSAVQLSLMEESGYRNPSKPLIGHYSKSGIPPARILREFLYREHGEVKEGDQFFVDIFQSGEKVNVIGTSKGKGFAGVVKRWGFHGGKSSHGSMFHRAPGSIGASAYPSHVVKGKKMPGQMGNQRVTVKNLIVIEADKDNNLLLVKGAVPGANRGYLLIKKADFHPEEPEPERAQPEQMPPKASASEIPKPEKDREQQKEPVKQESEDTESVKPEEDKKEEGKPIESKAEKVELEQELTEPPDSDREEPKSDPSEPEPSKEKSSDKPESESNPPEPIKQKEKE